jgi:hypothetical protein
MRALANLVVLASLIFSFATVLTAQSAGTAALTGAVTDPSGAAIANVSVTLTSNDNSQTRTAVTGPDGAYKFSLVPPGNYKVRFAAAGFKTAEIESVTLNVTETPELNRTLEVGAQAEQVTVEATAEALQTQTSTLGTVVGSHEVTALPLTNRNYTQILSLSAGTAVNADNASSFGKGTQDISVNGAWVTQNTYQMDGVVVNALSSNGTASEGIISPGSGIPNPDAIQEFKVQTSTYDASYGRNPGANVNVLTKSGTNVFHGTLFEFFRNTALNANDFFENLAGGPKQVLNQNQFGGVLGGPIKKDKLFFFGSYQYTKQLNGVASQGFSAAILPPIPSVNRENTAAFAAALGKEFCGQTGVFGGIGVACDGSNINPVALNILQLKNANGSYYIPGSTNGAYQSTVFSDPAQFRERQVVANADYLIDSKNTLAARYFWASDPAINSFPTLFGTLVPGTPGPITNSNTNASLKLTSVVTPTLVNEARASIQLNNTVAPQSINLTDPQLGITALTPTAPGPSSITILGQMSMFGATIDPLYDYEAQFQFADQVSWSHGKHTIRAGFEVERMRWNPTYAAFARGTINFLSFPDFLLGLSGCSSPSCSVANPGNTNGSPFSNLVSSGGFVGGPNGVVHGYRLTDLSSFIQDDFKVSSRLTLNLGLRWEFDGSMSDKYGNLSNIWLNQIETVPVPPATGTLAGYVVPANFTGAVPSGVLKSNRDLTVQSGPPLTDFGPRFGFAWQPLNTGRLVVRGGFGLFYDRVPPGGTLGGVNTSYPYAVDVSYTEVQSFINFSKPFPYPSGLVDGFAERTPTSQVVGNFLSPSLHDPLTRQYNLSLQWEFLPRWVLETGFVGASGINQSETARQFNTAFLASPSDPINGVTTNTVANVDQRVPFLGFSPSGLSGVVTDGIYNYNSLQVTLRRQFTHGLTLTAAYTWSKDLSDLVYIAGLGSTSTNSNDAHNLSQEYGPVGFNRPQRLVVTYSWDLPFGKHTGALDALISGWTLAGTTVAQDGQPLTITDALGGSIYGYTGNGRAQICPGATYGSIPTSGGVQSRLGGSAGGGGYFNGSAFCAPPAIGDGTGYGDSGVGIVQGPGQFNWDISLAKATRMRFPHEDSLVQFRAEFFNAFNHPQFSNPGTEVTSQAFGVIQTTSVNPRVVQLALKYVF